MAITLVNLGNSANDGTGDDLREAFVKVNNNFTEIQGQLNFTGENLGSSGSEVFSKLENYVLKFRRLVAGDNIQMQQFDNTIQISANIPDSRMTATTDNGSVILGNGITFNLVSGQGATVTGNENTKTITIDASLEEDGNPVLGASLDGNNFSITNVANISATSINGDNVYASNKVQGQTLQGDNLIINTINDVDLTDQLYDLFNFDNGGISYTVKNQLEAVVRSVGIDMGTFTSPSAQVIDLGNIVVT
jgi:hypothetical protein